jgi:hypothetical protein
MRYALIAAFVAACGAGFGHASAQQVYERREAPVAAPGQTVSEGRGDRRTPHTQRSEPAAPGVPAPETTGRTSSRDAGSDSSALEELKSAAEARRVRAAVGRTLDRIHALSRAASE